MVHYILFFIGLFFIGISLFKLKNIYKDASAEYLNNIREEKIKLMENISDAEAIMAEFNGLGEQIIRDLDERIYLIESSLEKANSKIQNNSLELQDEYDTQNHENTIQSIEATDNEEHNNKYTNDSMKEKIFKLHEEGYSFEDIAMKMNKGIGEIQLICNLGKQG